MSGAGVGGTLGSMRLVQHGPVRAPLDEADGNFAGEAFSCSGLCDARYPTRCCSPTSRVSSSLHRASPLTSPVAPLLPIPPLFASLRDLSAGRRAPRTRPPPIAIFSPSPLAYDIGRHRSSPPDDTTGDSGGGGGDGEMNDELELLIAERLRVKSPPAGWLLRAPWNAGARRTRRTTAHMHKFDDERRAGGRRQARARRTRLLGLLEAGRAPSECERRGGGSVDDGEGARYEFLVELRLDVRHPEPGPPTRLRAARLFVAVAIARLLPDKRHEVHVEQRVRRAHYAVRRAEAFREAVCDLPPAPARALCRPACS